MRLQRSNTGAAAACLAVAMILPMTSTATAAATLGGRLLLVVTWIFVGLHLFARYTLAGR